MRLEAGHRNSAMTEDLATLLVRPCFQQDLEMVQIIYAHHVLTGTGSFELEPPSLDTMVERWSHVVSNGWPYFVVSPKSDLTRVMGFAYAAQFRDRPAYRNCFEVSVYAAPTTMHQGIGTLLLHELLTALRGDGVREVLALIGDSHNQASIGLHAKLGFQHVGLLKNVGEKFNRALDVVVMQRTLIPPLV